MDATESKPIARAAGGPAARKHERAPMRAPGAVHEVDELSMIGLGVECVVSDLSRSGVAIVTRRPIIKERRVLVVLAIGGRKKAMFGVVRNVEYVEGGQHKVGIEFAPPPGAKVFQEGLATLGLGPVG